jgi:RNA polymerase sigma-70 factor, ECF subfamily
VRSGILSTAMLAEDAVLSMPPFSLWFRGRSDIRAWLEGRGSGCRNSVLVPVAACGAPAFGQYRDGGRQPWALLVLDLSGGRIAAITSFLDTASLFPAFGLPSRLDS